MSVRGDEHEPTTDGHGVWHHTGQVTFSPLFDWPPSPVLALRGPDAALAHANPEFPSHP